MKTIYKILIIINLIACVNLLEAQNIIRPKISCPNGIWVNSYNGVLFYQRSDVSITNKNLTMEAVFYYNSSCNEKNYGFGNGWSLGSEMRLEKIENGILVERGDGRSDLYIVGNNGEYTAPKGVFETLTKNDNGYIVRSKDGTQYIFNDTVSMKITQLKNRYDNFINYSYSNGLLSSMSDMNGRTINFSWGNELMTGISTSFDDRTWSFQYDINNNLTCVIDPMGGTSFYGYNDDNRINSFTDAEGYTTYITYNKECVVSRVKTDLTDKSIKYDKVNNKTIIVDYLNDGNSQFSTYVWDDLGRVVEKVGNCCGFSSKLAYDNDNNVIRHEDANGHATIYTYDGNGNMLTSTDALGYVETYTYEPDYNFVSSYTDPKGNRHEFSYDDNGNLITAKDAINNTSHYTYNQYGQLMTMVDANDNTTSYAYDCYGYLTSITDAMGNIRHFTYSSSGYLLQLTSPNNNITTFTYNNRGRITSVTDAQNNTSRMFYDKVGNITSVKDALFNETNFSYNALGQQVSVTGPMNNTMTYTYNAMLKTTQVTDAMNKATKMFYDDHNWLIMSIDAANDTTWYSYDNIGQIVSVEQPNGLLIEYQYDALNRLVSTSDQLGIISSNVYDANGNVIQSTDGNGNTTLYTYNALNKVTQITDPLGLSETFSYDANGNVLSYIDKNGHTKAYEYNDLNMLVTENDALGNTTSYTYDVNGNLSTVTDAKGNITSYTYDANDRLTRITFANAKTQQFWYDANGNMIKSKDESDQITLYQYDAKGKLVKKTYPDYSYDNYTYDLNGNMLSAVNNNATVCFTYDNVNRVVTESLNGKTTSYSYDTKHGVVDITYPGGRTIRENYDMRNRLSSIADNTEPLASYAYNANNFISQRIYKNGTSAAYTYDQNNNLIQLVDNPNILNYIMTYDNNGNMLSKKDNLYSNRSESYMYDDINQLIGFKKGVMNGVQIPNPLKNIQYVFDALGNRANVIDNNVATNYSSDNMNRYTSITSGQTITPHYDANGNMTQDDTHTYQYNFNNRMTGVDNGNTATYKYDALNRRIQKNYNFNAQQKTVNYYYAGDRIIEERDNNDAVEATYVFGVSIDDILQMKRGDNEYYYHKNHLGSTMALTNSIGKIVETYEYDPYGKYVVYNGTNNVIQQSSVGNTKYFTGRDYDIETGLYYYRARTMNPTIGRFMQNDAQMYVDGLNRYSYTQNNIINYIDTYGYDSESITETIIEINKNAAKSFWNFTTTPFKYVDNISHTYTWTARSANYVLGMFGSNIRIKDDITVLGNAIMGEKTFNAISSEYGFWKKGFGILGIGVDVGKTINSLYHKDYLASGWYGFNAGMSTWALSNPYVASVWGTFNFGMFIGNLINGIKIGDKKVEDIIFDKITMPLMNLPATIKNDSCSLIEGWSNIFNRNSSRSRTNNDDSAWLLCKYAGECNY